MKLYLGNTDVDWYNYLSKIEPEDVNFWQPGSHTGFKILKRGEPYLFRLKSPLNAIGGVGFFISYTKLPVSMAWQTFSNRNGFEAFEDFELAIQNYRKKNRSRFEVDPTIGCIVLTNPIFFKKKIGYRYREIGLLESYKVNHIRQMMKLAKDYGLKYDRES